MTFIVYLNYSLCNAQRFIYGCLVSSKQRTITKLSFCFFNF